MPSNTSKVASNTLYQILGRFVSAAETLIVTYLVTRALGPAGYGELTIVITYVTAFFVMADFGMNTIVVRSWSKEDSKVSKELTQILVLRLILALILSIIAVFTAYVLSRFSIQYTPIVFKGIVVGTLLIFGQSLYFSASLIFQTYFSYVRAFWASFWGNILALLLILLALKFRPDTLMIIIAFIIGSLIPTILAIYYIRPWLNFKGFSLDSKYWRQILLASLPTGIGLILNTLYTSADRILLSVLSTAAAVGIYGLAYKIFENILVIPNYFINASYPIMVKHRQESEVRLGQTIQKVFDGISLVVFPIIVGGSLLSPVLVSLVGGSEFTLAAPVLVILFVGTIAYFYSPLFRWLLLVEHRERWFPLIYGGALVFNVILNFVFIPKYDILAAAVINGLSELLVLVWSYAVVSRSLKLRINVRFAILCLVSSLAMGWFVNLFKDWYVISPIIFGGMAYFLALFAFTRGEVVNRLTALIGRA